MDILSHTLWVVGGAEIARRRKLFTRRDLVASAMLAAIPDLVHLVPVVFWVLFGDGSVADLHAYAVALPGEEPAMPARVAMVAHHLHCTMHSAAIASAITLVAWLLTGKLWLPLLAWWSHILIDVVTHSDDYYPSPVLYPFTYWGFDGLAWNRPAFLATNYALLVIMYVWLHRTRARKKAV